MTCGFKDRDKQRTLVAQKRTAANRPVVSRVHFPGRSHQLHNHTHLQEQSQCFLFLQARFHQQDPGESVKLQPPPGSRTSVQGWGEGSSSVLQESELQHFNAWKAASSDPSGDAAFQIS